MQIEFPLTSSRVHSMTQNYLTPMDKTFKTFGAPPCSLMQGVEKTVCWLDEQEG
jgi:GlcNAc-P-P-Und epimerase